MEGNIKLPVAIEQKFDLVQQPPLDDMYFGREIGRVTFSKMTEAQAIKLVRIKSPYITLKEIKQKSANLLEDMATDVQFSAEVSKKK